MSRNGIEETVAPEGRRVVRAFLMEVRRWERRDGIVDLFLILIL
jgi:hypothetical protein